MMKTIKIFLASSNDLQDERNAIELIVSRENKKFAAKGIQFELVRWEQLPQSFQPKRVQKFFNEKMLECEVMVALFYDRIGDFTYEEFQTAFKSFNKGKNPRHIFVFFKTGQISTEAVTDEFYEVQKLRQKIEHHEQIYCKYENLDQLTNILKEQMHLIIETYKNEASSPQEPPVHNVEPKRTNTSDKPFYRNGIFWLFAIIFVSIFSALWIYQSTPYSFTIPNHFLRSDGVLVIHSENWKANQNKHLNVEFDGFKYAKSGKPTEKDNLGNQVWHFRISEHHPPKNYLKDGEHRIRLGFPGKKYSDEVYKICFITKDLIIDAALISQNKGTKTKLLKGRAATESQLKENTISVDVIFYHEGPTTVHNVPVKCVDDPNAQLVYYEFETAFEGFPEISKDDPRYEQPFFKLNITDKAGNKHVQKHSYAQFVAAGALQFETGNANIRLKKFHPEGSDSLSAHLTYLPVDQTSISGALPNIKLKVRSIAKDIRTLDWTAENFQQITPHTLIYRNDQYLASTTTNNYTDTEILESETVSYKVIQEDSNGIKYTSNVEKVDVIKEKTFLPGSLFVKIVPEDAAISFVDDNKTYSKGMALDPGQYKIQGKKKGYESQTKEFSITAGKKSEISINLEPIAPTTKTWTDPTTNMVFVWIPAGCFQMGSPESEEGRGSDEGPVHKVCVDGFWLGKYEVTRGQFSRFITATKYKTDAEKEGSSYGYKDGDWKKVKGYNWKNSGFEQNDSHPVISVSWNDAKEMAKWMSKNSKYTFKLPTEAEWEYACRAGTQTSRFWGDDPDQACKYANVADKSAKKQFSNSSIHNCTDGYVFTAPVGKFLDNPFQLSDMLGNVWEWCEDAYSSDAYKKHGSKNPVISGGAGRVFRGGSWFNFPRNLRSANRFNDSPGNRSNNLGFRLLRTR
jgi:formylglycine-generating enzyme required for sulfatase activity